MHLQVLAVVVTLFCVVNAHANGPALDAVTEAALDSAIAEAAGFELAARSDLNRNEKDSHDHPQGVWSLPPSLALGEQDREKYLAIGESDRMTLEFVRPAQ